MSNINNERKRYEQFLFNKINYILYLKRNKLEDTVESKKIYDESDEYKNIKEIFDQIYGE
ncbi:MAG: hypothetical protein ACRC28_08570 [Clostridium sp.]|uniref:hypothetical protein n=1 Tax=Clostridia TaxID=186801 RepID=UPI003F3256BA